LVEDDTTELDQVAVYELLLKPHPLPPTVAIEELAPNPIPHFVPTQNAEDMEDDLEVSAVSMKWWKNPWIYSVM
jgi:hypothetical protein